jgi:hypothetical protein
MHFKGWTTDVRLLAEGGVLLTIAIIMGYIAEVAQPEGMPQWLPHAYRFCFIGSSLFMLAAAFMRARMARSRARCSRGEQMALAGAQAVIVQPLRWNASPVFATRSSQRLIENSDRKECSAVMAHTPLN